MNPRCVRPNVSSYSLFGLVALGAVVLGLALAGASGTEAPVDPVKMEAVVEAVLKQMTIEEKALMCQGGSQRGTAEIARLGIQPMLMYNGNRGTNGGGTLFPSGIGQGASWNPELVEKIGRAIALEAKAKNFPVLLAPAINIQRDPVCGRVFEYQSEDPFLNGRLAAGFVKGVQGERVVACAKHFAANSQEMRRDDVDSVMDERTLREIYVPGFEAAVEAGVWAVMSGANRFRGEACCQNDHLLNQVLKKDLGFKGFVITDWSGAKNTLKAANGGCDLSMPGKPTSPFSQEAILAALKSGAVTETTIEDKARRILRAAYFCGHLAGSPAWEKAEVDFKAHGQLALEAARESMVLLKNKGGLLPLEKGKVKSVAVVGTHAELVLLGGGSSGLKPPYYVTALQGLRDLLKNDAQIVSAPFDVGSAWEIVSDQYVQTPEGKPGWQALYLGTRTGTKKQKAELARVDSKIDFNWEMASPDRFVIDSGTFRGQWKARLRAPVSGAYLMRISGGGSDIALAIDGKQVLRKFQGTTHLRCIDATVNLEQGREYNLEMNYRKTEGDAWVKLDWIRPDAKEVMAKAMEQSIAAARHADVALVFAGLDHGYDTEAADRENLRIPAFQEQLIEAVVKANPRTVVVLTNGSPIEMDPWLEKVPAVLETWYPGLEHGHAVADVLFGEFNPSGKLPLTFPSRYQDSPAHPSRQQEDRGKIARFNEGVFVGYRWFDQRQIAPLFPFGHGLSYTTFEYRNLRATPEGGKVRVSLEIANTGSRKGTEIAQIYVAAPKGTVPRPVRELKGYARVSLEPGESRVVDLELEPRALSYWSEAKNGWVIEPGVYGIQAGSSSRDIRLETRIER